MTKNISILAVIHWVLLISPPPTICSLGIETSCNGKYSVQYNFKAPWVHTESSVYGKTMPFSRTLHLYSGERCGSGHGAVSSPG